MVVLLGRLAALRPAGAAGCVLRGRDGDGGVPRDLLAFRGAGCPVDIASRRLATITLKEPLRVADCLDPAAAGFGVTATTSAGRPYPSVSHPWARRFFQAGFDGVRYGVAHHPSLGETSFALFGPTGAHDAGPGTYVDDVLPDELVVAAKERFGFLVI
jgi:hypothetical protein